MFEAIDDVDQALDDELGSPLPSGVTLYENAENAEDVGPYVEILNNQEQCELGLPTAVLENIVKNGEIYPNPVGDQLNIRLKRALPNVKIEVYDARGMQCSNVRITQTDALTYVIDASSLCAHVGVVMIKSEGDAETHKFIKGK